MLDPPEPTTTVRPCGGPPPEELGFWYEEPIGIIGHAVTTLASCWLLKFFPAVFTAAEFIVRGAI
jgi:hypothetical protein